MSQKFKHNCHLCKFLGHFHTFDVHICDKAIGGPTIIARFGDDDYASCPLSCLQERIADDFRASVSSTNTIVVGQLIDYQTAMLMALANEAIKEALP